MSFHQNLLIHETSPYLLQHAHNPVDWFPWGEEALSKAKKENKPILVSIGYAACHWCHVMERESFEDETTAKLMNENFVNIKIDREERPDLDHIYMDAVQAISGSGGWPLNVFLTPEGKPFFGGTYFPPQPAYNRPSWTDTLNGIVQAFRERRHEVDAQAENLTSHILQTNSFGLQKVANEEVFAADKTSEVFNNIMQSADKEWGGFGKAPKFPQTFSIQFLLQYHAVSNNKEALDQALLSLDKMIEGGIYDQVGGGFSRYSTDKEWLAPHFEKMLYDNALLIEVIGDAYKLTGKERYKEVIQETMEFVQRELLYIGNDGNAVGFFSALDADSEGVEGKFYVWNINEVKDLLGKNANLFCEFYDITETGNWEHTNILRVKKSVEKFADEKNKTVDEIKIILAAGRKKLLEKRSKRIRPLLDDKIILGWNALMNSACSNAFEATGIEDYRQLAINNMHFLLEKFSIENTGGFHHTWKNEKAKFPGFLDDYAFLIKALLNLQEITANTDWLRKAADITNYVIEHFSETETGFFFYTRKDQKDVIVRKKEVYDGAVTSGNSVMAKNLYQLGILFDNEIWKKRSREMILGIGKAIIKYPASFGNWCSLHQEIQSGTNEIAIIGENFETVYREMLANYIPYRVIMGSSNPGIEFPLLAGKSAVGKTTLFLCRNYTCQEPVFSTKDLIGLINSDKNR